MNDFVAFISYQEGFILKNISFSILLLISSYLLMICTVTLLKTQSIRNLYFLLISILIIQMNLIFEKIKVQNSNQFIVFHQSKNTILGNRLGNILVIYENEKNPHKNPYSPLSSFKNTLRNLKIRRESRIKNGIKIHSKNVLIIDSSGVYSYYYSNPDIVLLISSPKINMDRMIEILRPKMVIADGSNYLSYALKWGKSCNEKSVQFYNTSEDGAFVYNYSP
jgi:competence protein ComEC